MTSSRKQLASPQRSISILIPVLNEEKNIRPTVNRLLRALTVTIEQFEIIIINDGSTDATRQVVDDLTREFPTIKSIHNEKNRGLGYCYARGYREASMAFFAYIPGDNTWPHRSFVELFGNLGRADIVTSYALNPEVRPITRRIISKLYTHVLNVAFGRHLRYFNGLTIYPVSFLRQDPATTFGFGFQAEVLLKALATGMSYVEVGLPIDERTAGGSKAVTVKNILSVFSTVSRVFWDMQILKRWSRVDTPVPRTSQVASDVHTPQICSAKASVDAGPTPDELLDKVIVITGASSGIGRALAIRLAKRNRVFVCSRSISRLNEALGDVPNVTPFECDLAEATQVAAFQAFVGEHCPHIDVLVNCAGGFGVIGTLDDADAEAWVQSVRHNLLTTVLPIKSFLHSLESSPEAAIINFSGGGAFSPFPNFSAYACAKAAIVRLTETLAVELAPRGIAVNAVAPGLLATDAHLAVLEAGEEMAGSLQYHRAKRLLDDAQEGLDVARMDAVLHCVETLAILSFRGLTGKTISANFDPWASEDFGRNIVDIVQSELYTMRRVNVLGLPEGLLRSRLIKSWALKQK